MRNFTLYNVMFEIESNISHAKVTRNQHRPSPIPFVPFLCWSLQSYRSKNWEKTGRILRSRWNKISLHLYPPQFEKALSLSLSTKYTQRSKNTRNRSFLISPRVDRSTRWFNPRGWRASSDTRWYVPRQAIFRFRCNETRRNEGSERANSQ